jgi:hypothetical protein
MSITRGNADNYETDAMTVGGNQLKIKITEAGYYYIDIDGPGGRPKISEQIFTSLSEARKARDAYINDNKAMIEKKKFIEEMASRPSIKEQRKAERIAKSDSE